MTYWDRLRDQLTRNVNDAKPVLRDYDVTANVLTGGEPGQTLSTRAALGARAGIWRWCVLCRLLSWLVQRDHCEQTLDPNATVPASVYWRAGLCFAVATLAVLGVGGVALYWGVTAASAAAAGAAALVGEMVRRRPGRKP